MLSEKDKQRLNCIYEQMSQKEQQETDDEVRVRNNFNQLIPRMDRMLEIVTCIDGMGGHIPKKFTSPPLIAGTPLNRFLNKKFARIELGVPPALLVVLASSSETEGIHYGKVIHIYMSSARKKNEANNQFKAEMCDANIPEKITRACTVDELRLANKYIKNLCDRFDKWFESQPVK